MCMCVCYLYNEKSVTIKYATDSIWLFYCVLYSTHLFLLISSMATNKKLYLSNDSSGDLTTVQHVYSSSINAEQLSWNTSHSQDANYVYNFWFQNIIILLVFMFICAIWCNLKWLNFNLKIVWKYQCSTTKKNMWDYYGRVQCMFLASFWNKERSIMRIN